MWISCQGPATALTWKSKSGMVWYPTNLETLWFQPAKAACPGITRYANYRISDIRSSFGLFVTHEIIQVIVEMTNLHGQRKNSNWAPVDPTEIRGYIGLLILAEVYRSRGESIHSLWGQYKGLAIFRATMSEKRFRLLSGMIRFNDTLSPQARRTNKHDKLAPIRQRKNK